MTPALPSGEPVGPAGPLAGTTAEPRTSPFGVYVHVPFCKVRCGYCDFNTYTATELGGGANLVQYADQARAEVSSAARDLDRLGLGARPVSTVFFGGGTPTMLPASDLAAILAAIRLEWGLSPGAEVTTEANPDSVDEAYLHTLAASGFTRVSFGMQSAVPHVLQTLERTHDPSRIGTVVTWARRAGLQVSLDLIYGTPGESADDWRASLDAALSHDIDHISAYALVVEPGTKLAAQVRRGEVQMPDLDTQADYYEIADDVLASGGYEWYEISNWARRRGGALLACQHNLGYWRGHDWWGIGPGAHSYLADVARAGDRGQRTAVRWWNVKHPRAYAQALEGGSSPAAGLEWLTAQDTSVERVMLGVRLREGLPIAEIGDGRRHVPGLIADGLIDGRTALAGAVQLTLRGRLLADGIVARLTTP